MKLNNYNEIENKVRESLNSQFIDIRNEAIIYASHELNYSNREIGLLCGLKTSTIRNYIKTKLFSLLEKAIQRFGKIFGKIRERIFRKNVPIIFETSTTREGECAYIIEYFYDYEHVKKAFLKIGKTDNIKERICQHLAEYEKKYGTLYPVVKRLYYFADADDAQSAENALRKHYQQKENCGYIKLDRFSNVEYSAEDLDNDANLSARLAPLDFIEMA